MNEVDLSNVKVWSHKLRNYYPIKPQELVLFSENIGKCWNCGFYRNNCMCKEPISLKKIFTQRINKMYIKFHRRRCSKLMRKSNRLEQRAYNHLNVVRYLQEAPIDWKKIEIKELLNGGIPYESKIL